MVNKRQASHSKGRPLFQSRWRLRPMRGRRQQQRIYYQKSGEQLIGESQEITKEKMKEWINAQ